MRIRPLILAGALVGAAAPTARAQAPDTTAVTTLSGVYTADQLAKGKDIYGAACLSCHKPIEFTGEKFWATVVSRPLWDFFKYLKTDMPQDNPGSLGDEDYASVMSYIFSLNAMPAGEKPLPTDSVSLMRIKAVHPAPAAPAVPLTLHRITGTGRGK